MTNTPTRAEIDAAQALAAAAERVEAARAELRDAIVAHSQAWRALKRARREAQDERTEAREARLALRPVKELGPFHAAPRPGLAAPRTLTARILGDPPPGRTPWS